MIFSLTFGLRFLIFLSHCLFMDRNVTVEFPCHGAVKNRSLLSIKTDGKPNVFIDFIPEHEYHKVESLLRTFYIGRELHLTSSSPQIAPAVRLLYAKTQF